MNVVLLIKDFAIGKKFDKSGMPNQSGGERHGLNHAKELIRLGHHVTIMAKKKYWFTKFRELYDGCIDLVRLHGSIRWFEILMCLVTTHRNIDAFYIIGTPKFSVWAIAYAKLTGKPVTLALTGKAELFRKDTSFRNRLFSSCDQYIATTHEIYDGFISLGHIDRRKISIIPHGIDVHRYQYVKSVEREVAKCNVHLDSSEPVLLFCARVAKNKGILVALDVWKKLHIKYPKATFYIVGGGENYLLDQARQVSLECDNSIIVTGEVDYVEYYHRLADVYIFPSEHEGLPTSLLEVMSSGLPTVCSDIGGCNDLIINDRTGYRVSTTDVDSYVKYISKLFDNSLLRYELGRRASEYVKTYCSYDVVSKEMELTVTNQRKVPIDMLKVKP
ncbi:glycosyltransferase family 1 protein [Veillonella denticariosi JCM 15641]|uniref:Glycosyltransferase family 1 protein n=1 Tax=Veillonella denticariosi JCM 15641 TaxID=1298594 RepID=A0A2S7ZAT1_9FIRM|nr:glycosyltransferase family 4 protein [Veillonella denticariosi]PQL20398.1 glycosyltransferase family 1 protein [Veillonella denticariosi JCM 15641]